MSGVTLGEKYRDSITGFEGVAVARYTYLNGCVRIDLERADKDGKPESWIFDEQRLVAVTTGWRVRSTARVGGPRDDPRARFPEPSR